MIIILNGSVGVGKTSVAWALNSRFNLSVMVDGDYLGAVHPFRLDDDARMTYLYRTVAHLIAFHQAGGYEVFIVNYVFESTESLSELLELLRPLDDRIHSFRVTCAEREQRRRITARRTSGWRWELERFLVLNAVQQAAAQRGDLGTTLDTTERTVAEVAAAIEAAVS